MRSKICLHNFDILLRDPSFSVPIDALKSFPVRRAIALRRIQSLAVTVSSPWYSKVLALCSSMILLPSTTLSTTASSGREKYIKLNLVRLACSPGGLTTRWRFEVSTPAVNLTSASPRLMIAWPLSGLTQAHSWELGRRTCKPPS